MGQLRSAVSVYEMIQPGDRIAVGLSGGKDSFMLALLLKRLSMFLPEHFDLSAICIDLGFEDFDPAPVISFCKKYDIPLHIEKTHISKIVFDVQKPKSSCALCSNLRRGALNNAAKALYCNKVALGHHKDDAIETFYMSMLYEGRFSLFSPVTYLSRSEITVIRPMIYIEEGEISRTVGSIGIELAENPCQIDGFSRRELVKKLIKNLEETNPSFKNNIFNAILDSGIDGWKNPIAWIKR
jgi:tRNA 2-thiocytidine biosynthesis protein TtcA